MTITRGVLTRLLAGSRQPNMLHPSGLTPTGANRKLASCLDGKPVDRQLSGAVAGGVVGGMVGSLVGEKVVDHLLKWDGNRGKRNRYKRNH